MASSTPEARVLVVEDEPELREMYAGWLAEDYLVSTAEDAPAALLALDDTVDVVLLDRKLPETMGEELIPRIQERNEECQIAMVTSVDAEWEILEMDFDAYLTKPVREDDLRILVDALCEHDYDVLAEQNGVTL